MKCVSLRRSIVARQGPFWIHIPIPRVLSVWKGLQLMYRGRNQDVETAHVKGAIGPETGFETDLERGLQWVEVQFTHPIRWSKAVHIRPEESEANLGLRGGITRTQIPLVLPNARHYTCGSR